MWNRYGLKLRIWKLERSLKGQKSVSMTLTWGEYDDSFTVRYDLDMRPLDEGYYPKLVLTHETEDENSGLKKTVSYQVYTTQTRCHFGGERLWFRCPLGQCGRRVGVLYFSGRYFGCRNCVGYEHATRGINYNSRSAAFIAALEYQDYEEKHLKRYTWRGKETRKMQRFRRLCERAGNPRYPDWLLKRSRSKFRPAT